MTNNNRYYVYILKCSDNSYYIGITNNIDRRLSEHQSGLTKKSYTYCRRPVTLVSTSIFTDVRKAIQFEKQIKGWSRAKKEALINSNWEKIIEISNRKNT